MARTYLNLEHLKFLLYDVHRVEDLLTQPYYEHFDRESIDMMVDAAKKLADTYLFPFYEDMDRNEPELVDGKIQVHPSVVPYIKAAGEGGWISVIAPTEQDGMQAPSMLAACAALLFGAANNPGTMFTGLTAGAANLISSFGSAEQQAEYLPLLFSGQWQGTMALTEPQAGSSLSDITTTAIPQADGTYKIKGQKIYISAGDYEGIENVVHMLLARIEGAPKGTKGISLFIVPKHRKTEKGELEFNDVKVGGLFHKLGQKGAPAAHLIYGEGDDCVGYLVGAENKGLHYMFQMMNEARIGVGLSATSVASAAYHASLQYAQERPQGRSWENRGSENPPTLIINHPDVRRMLLLQKSVVEGSMSLGLQCTRYADLSRALEGEDAEKYHLLLELLTPVLKTYPSEMGMISISNGVQVFGGGGFCKDFPAENYYRDIRIYPIYEGTTGIQSMDLLGRKCTMQNGRALKLFFAEVKESIDAARTHEGLRKYADKLAGKMKKLQEVSMHLVSFAMKGQVDRFLADATLFMEFFGHITIAWQWLKMATNAKEQILTQNPGGARLAFLESKIHTMKFFYAYELPKTLGLAERLIDEEILTMPHGEKELSL